MDCEMEFRVVRETTGRRSRSWSKNWKKDPFFEEKVERENLKKKEKGKKVEKVEKGKFKKNRGKKTKTRNLKQKKVLFFKHLQNFKTFQNIQNNLLRLLDGAQPAISTKGAQEITRLAYKLHKNAWMF